MTLSFLLLIFATISPLTSGTNLALTYDAASSTCTAACKTCSDSNATCLTSKNTSVLEQVFNTTKKNAADIKEIKQKLDSLASSIKENTGTINNVLLLLEGLLMLHNSSNFSPLPTSCQEIKRKQPNSPSGVYLLAVNGSETKHIYCHMEELCSSGGGWTRLAYLNMSDSRENCPSGFRLYQSGGVRACGRAHTNNYSCQSVQFPSNGISYSQVCGRVVGYQYASPDAVQRGEWRNQQYIGGTDPKHNDINSAYVDGVSITRGSPRQHVWTLMATLTGHATSDGSCPCSTGSHQSPQSFVNNSYYCESGAGTSWSHKLYTSDPLWDGKGCYSTETACCSVPGLPWFHRDYGNTTTTDYLELRVCADQETDDEDIPVSFYEIYVK